MVIVVLNVDVVGEYVVDVVVPAPEFWLATVCFFLASPTQPHLRSPNADARSPKHFSVGRFLRTNPLGLV